MVKRSMPPAVNEGERRNPKSVKYGVERPAQREGEVPGLSKQFVA